MTALKTLSPLQVVGSPSRSQAPPFAFERVPVEALEQQVHDIVGTDASVFPSLMLAQTRGDENVPALEWLRPRTTVQEYLRGMLA